GETPAQHYPRSMRRARRLSAPALGVLTAALVVAASWPAAASAGIHTTSPGPGASPAPAPTAQPWLLGHTTPTLLNPRAAYAPVVTAAKVTPLRHVLPADIVAVSATPLPAKAVRKVRKLSGVRAVEAVDAARVKVNGKFAAILGVDPSSFRRFAAKPTAKDNAFWRSVENGNLGVSFEMGKQDKLPTGTAVTVNGRQPLTMHVGDFGTVGIGGVDAVITDDVARSLGFPVGNAIVISAAPSAKFTKLTHKIKKLLPHAAHVQQLVVQVPGTPATGSATATTGSGPAAGSAPAGSVVPVTGGLVSSAVLRTMLLAAESRLGMPYVWGANGPKSFDCSGLVQWSFAQAGVIMPRVAADQARTGPAVPISRLAAGDLLFYHTDPTAPGYISHVAIYLGHGKMIQAPQPGMNVEVVPVDLGSGFAGAIDVSPAVAAQVAGTSV
ncbi:MAG: C40 family peptidase, partial [Actinobacteria bacterium]|nr:C40 family peptidase [Actinomycetota bacterium]